ncbi:MAG: hypothetical protein JWQ81_4593 [Amycolatopsis sp.]|uniref:hypothetical protein n=1 Tax=Amycolatopsis sp. TaxID=37632 RepID=UPI00261F3556|nr:hypothetical protein [Amycolatopsis sp.]MCU1683854.1 hypothetical protein [Amycolatopsis sp.]
MGISVYLRNQVHAQTYAGTEVSLQFERVVAQAQQDELLAGVHPHADTMFNVAQLSKISEELTTVQERCPELADDIAALRVIFETIERQRGYLWVLGD